MVPMPKHLEDVTVDEIFSDTKYYIGLMAFFFTWSGKLLRISWPGSKLGVQEFKDDFHDAFEKMLKMRSTGKIRATTPQQLYCLLRALFRNYVYLRKLQIKHKEMTALDLDVNKLAYPDYNYNNDPVSLILIIESVIKVQDILTPGELRFWNIFKLKPDKKDKHEIMEILNLTEVNYDTTKHRVFRKVSSLNLKNILF